MRTFQANQCRVQDLGPHGLEIMIEGKRARLTPAEELVVLRMLQSKGLVYPRQQHEWADGIVAAMRQATEALRLVKA